MALPSLPGLSAIQSTEIGNKIANINKKQLLSISLTAMDQKLQISNKRLCYGRGTVRRTNQ